MAKIKTKYICQECGYETGKWLGKCPSCNSFSTFSEEIVEKTSQSKVNTITATNKALDLESIAPISEIRTKTKIGELDRVLGGGIVQGSLTLVGGDPGIGKSTLLLQICQAVGK